MEYYQPGVDSLDRDNIGILAKFRPRKKSFTDSSVFCVATTHLVILMYYLGICLKCYSTVTCKVLLNHPNVIESAPYVNLANVAQIVGTRLTGKPIEDVYALCSFAQCSPI